MMVDLLPLYILLLVAATAVEPPKARRLAFVGLVWLALGTAAYAVSTGSDRLSDIARAAAASPNAFFVINTGFLGLGAVLCVAAALLAIHRGPPVSPGLALALLVIGVFALWRLGPLFAQSGGWRPALAAATLLGGVTVGGVVTGHLREGRSMRPDHPLEWPGEKTRSVGLMIGFGVGALGVVAGPYAELVFLGLGVSAVADFLDRRRRGLARIPWLPAAALLLAPAWWFMATIAGPVGLRLATLPEVPFSIAAERLLALPLALVAWAFVGPWPVDRLFPGGLLAPLGIALWLRVASPAVTGGLQHWQPLLVPLGVIGVWGAALAGRGAAACNALAFLALASEARSSLPAALILGATALTLSVGAEQTPRSATHRLAWSLAMLALPFAFEAGLRAQVTYTLLAAAGAALACWTCIDRGGERTAT